MSTGMPRVVRVSLWLLLGSIAAGPFAGILDPRPSPKVPDNVIPILVEAIVLLGIPLIAAFALIIFKAYQGRNWARLVHSALTVFGALSFLKDQVPAFGELPVLTAVNVSITVVGLVSVMLLFAPASNVWYSTNRSTNDAT